MLAGRGFATAALLSPRRAHLHRHRQAAGERAADDPQACGSCGPATKRDPFPWKISSEVERDTLERLRGAGVLRMDRNRGYIDPDALQDFTGRAACGSP